MPMEYIRFSNETEQKLRCGSKWTKLFFDRKWARTHIKALNCPRIVAHAAPAIPQPNTKINRGAATTLTATDSKAEIIALRG